MSLFWQSEGDDWIKRRNAYINAKLGPMPSQMSGGIDFHENPHAYAQFAKADEAWEKKWAALEKEFRGTLSPAERADMDKQFAARTAGFDKSNKIGKGLALGMIGAAAGGAALTGAGVIGGGTGATAGAAGPTSATGGTAAATGATTAAGAGAAGGGMSLGSLWSNVPLIGSAVSAVSGLYGAAQQAKANDAAVSGQLSAAAAQQKLAQEQWDYQKNIYLPKAMKQADDQLALSKRIVDRQLEDAAYYRGVSEETLGQAKKSWKYQDQYMGLTDDYMSGKMGNIEADRANADVEQAYGKGLQSMMRNAQRYGINPGSGAFASAMGDMYNEKMLAGAGAQTGARQAARQKAESMVAVAAGAGQAGFGTGMSAGQLAGSSLNGAGGTNNSSLTGLNSVSGTFGQGALQAGSNYGAASGSWNSAVRNAGSPVADYIGGLATGAVKAGTANNWFNPSSPSVFRADDPYRNAGYFGGSEGE